MAMDYTNKIVTVTEGKNNFLKIVDEITQLKDVVIFSKNGLPVTIMHSIDDFEAMRETMEILGNSSVMKSLRKSAKQRKAGQLLDIKNVF